MVRSPGTRWRGVVRIDLDLSQASSPCQVCMMFVLLVPKNIIGPKSGGKVVIRGTQRMVNLLRKYTWKAKNQGYPRTVESLTFH